MTQLPPDYLSTTNPFNYDQPLPPVARTTAVTQVPPAKKITFYKSGDPQFGGVKMAINQRSFKSFNALMDDLSHRVPLPFGVRTITTPRGIHCISTLDQLEDGGCYLCSDKKYVTPISIGTAGRRAGPPRNSHQANELKKAAQEVKREDYSTAFTQQRLRIPKKITLVKNGDLSIRRPIILNRRNARSFKTLLDEISEIMQFTVKKLYTVDGKKIDSMQALLHCPNVLMCVGRELFKPIVTENSRKPSVEKLPGLTSRSNSHIAGENNDMNFGLKAKKSVIHPRSSMSNRSMRLSLSSEKSYPNGLTTSSENGASCSNNCPHSKGGDLVHSLVNDDIEKRVHVNKDGSLSVEMKVRFRLLNDETLQWSTQIKKSSLLNMLPCEESGIDEDNGVDLTEKSNPEASSEVDDSLYPCDADSYISKLDESEIEEAHCHNCGKPCKDYDIWKNPMHTSQKEEPGIRNTWYTHSSCSSTSSLRRIVRKKMASVDSIHTSSSGEYSEHVVQESSCYTETVENRVGYHTIRKCCCRCDCTKTNTSQRESPEEPELVACSVNSQNEEDGPGEAIVVQDGDESHGSRAGSRKSKSSPGSVESQKKGCEETSNVGRSSSSCSVKKEVEDIVGCPSSANSVCSKPSKCSTPKDTQDEVSENDQVILSFSNESCSKNDTGEDPGKEEEEINEIHSVSENVALSQSVKDEGSECGRGSTERPDHCKTCNGSSRRSDSDEVHMCSAASSSSKVSKKSQHSQNHLETGSKVSARSSVTSSSRKKKTNSSLHAEDGRSNSKISSYSQEGEKRAVEGQASHDSSSPRSNVSLSDAAAPLANEEEGTGSTSKCYSKSCKSSQKGSQPEDISKTSSPCLSFSDSIEKNGTGDAPVRSRTPSASIAESTCSKCGHVKKTDDLQSVHSKVSLHSDVKSKCAETEASGKSGGAGSQSSMARSSKPRRKKKNSLHADIEHSSRASASGSASVYSLHRPTPPKGRPGNRKGRTVVLKNSNTTSMCTESESMADKEKKENASSYAPEMDTAKGEDEEEGSCHQKSQGEPSGEDDALQNSEEVIPSSLPNTTPEEVVHEWLRKIPSETLPMKDEMQDDGEGSALDIETPSCSESQEPLEEELEGKKEDPEGCKSTAEDEAAVEGAEEEALDEEGNKDPSDEKASEAMSEEAEGGTAECNQSVISSQNNHKKDLPSTIQTSVQIMKALLASKQEAKLDRSHSLPEVSPTMGRKLSNSANILITCLASLQLLDEELGPSAKSECLNRPRYTELLNIFQALWFGCTSEKSGPSSDQHGEVQEKTAAGFKGHNSKDGDFTPMSSSGVDVSSGDGGSREGSVAGPQDCALPPEKTEEATGEEEEANEEQEEKEEASQPCSKSEGGEKTESAGGEEVAEAHENLGSDCETGQEEEKEMAEEHEVEETNGEEGGGNVECEENSAEADAVQEEAQEETVVAEAEDSPSPGNADEAAAEPGNNEAAPDAVEGNEEGEPKLNAEEQPVVADPEPNSQAIPKASPSIIQQRSIDPDPVWVLKLLKKIEKEFLTHYVSAMNDFKVKWNLQNSEELDLMIAELKEEVSRRIEKSIEVELRKIRSRAGTRTPRPPENGLQHESTLQAQHRRRRLQSLHRMSLFNDRNRSQSLRPETRDSSRESDDAGFLFRTTIRDGLNEQPSEDEYCPCDACIKKKMAARSTMNTVVVMGNAPVVKAFDLQQILRMKKADGAERKVGEGIPEGVEGEEAAPGKQAEAASEPEENTETEPTVEGEPDEAGEPEVKAEEAAVDGEEAPEDKNCEEEEGEEGGNKEEEGKEEAEEGGGKEEEEVVKDEGENPENEEEEEETVKGEEEGNEEDVKEEEAKEEEETEKEAEEAKEEEETLGEDDNKEEEEATGEDAEEAEEKEEEEAVEEGEEGNEEVKNEEETVNEEDQEEEMKEEEEEEEKEEEETVKEGEDNEEVKEEEEIENEEDEEGKEEEIVNEEDEEGKEEEVEAAEEKEEIGNEEEVNEEEEVKEEEVEETEEKEEEETVKEENNEEEEVKEEEEAEKKEGENVNEEEVNEEEEVKEEEETEEGKEEEVKEGEVEEAEEEEEEEQEEGNEEEEEKEEEEPVNEEEEEIKEEEPEEAEEKEEEEKEDNEEEAANEEEVEETEVEDAEESVKGEEEAKEEVEKKEEEETVDEEEEEAKEVEAEEAEEDAKEEEVEEPEAKEEETVAEEEEAKEEEDAKEEEEVDEEDAKDSDEINEEEAEGENVEEEENEAEETELEQNHQEEEAKSEGQETNEAGEKDEAEEHEATPSEEVEEDPKMEDETEGIEVSEAEAGGGDNAAEEEAEEEASPEAESVEAADVGDEAELEENAEAEGNREEAEGPMQDDVDEGGKEAEEDGTNEDAQSPRNGSALSHGSSMGNCSLQSQKGSEDESDREDCKEEGGDNNEGDGEARMHTETRSPKMYPDSDEEEEEEEEDGASSQTSAVKEDESQTNENKDGQTPKKKEEKSEAIDQDDLDF